MECGFELCEKDEEVWPVVLVLCGAGAGGGEGSYSGDVAGSTGEMAQSAGHGLAQELGWVVVELVRFVAVVCFLFVGEVYRWFAGECPGVDAGVD